MKRLLPEAHAVASATPRALGNFIRCLFSQRRINDHQYSPKGNSHLYAQAGLARALHSGGDSGDGLEHGFSPHSLAVFVAQGLPPVH